MEVPAAPLRPHSEVTVTHKIDTHDTVLQSEVARYLQNPFRQEKPAGIETIDAALNSLQPGRIDMAIQSATSRVRALHPDMPEYTPAYEEWEQVIVKDMLSGAQVLSRVTSYIEGSSNPNRPDKFRAIEHKYRPADALWDELVLHSFGTTDINEIMVSSSLTTVKKVLSGISSYIHLCQDTQKLEDYFFDPENFEKGVTDDKEINAIWEQSSNSFFLPGNVLIAKLTREQAREILGPRRFGKGATFSSDVTLPDDTKQNMHVIISFDNFNLETVCHEYFGHIYNSLFTDSAYTIQSFEKAKKNLGIKQLIRDNVLKLHFDEALAYSYNEPESVFHMKSFYVTGSEYDADRIIEEFVNSNSYTQQEIDELLEVRGNAYQKANDLSRIWEKTLVYTNNDYSLARSLIRIAGIKHSDKLPLLWGSTYQDEMIQRAKTLTIETLLLEDFLEETHEYNVLPHSLDNISSLVKNVAEAGSNEQMAKRTFKACAEALRIGTEYNDEDLIYNSLLALEKLALAYEVPLRPVMEYYADIFSEGAGKKSIYNIAAMYKNSITLPMERHILLNHENFSSTLEEENS